jgi:hypothetical protein
LVRLLAQLERRSNVNGWVLHDSFKTAKAANSAGVDIINLALAKAVKVTQKGKKTRPYMLYILPLKSREAK